MKKFLKISGALFLTMLMAGLLTLSCKKSTTDLNAGKIDPSTIATANLVAYFPFDGNGTESIGAITPTVTTGVTYVTGQRGQAYQGANLAHLLYTLPVASKLKSLTSFSVALWIKSPLVTGDPEPIFFQIGKSDDLFWGNLTLSFNRLSATADSLQFHAFFLKTGVTWSGQNVGFVSKNFVINTWAHMIFEYDATTSKYKIFRNGVQVVTNAGVENRYANPASDPLGALAFANADVINIGAWRPKSEGTATDTWMGWFLGNLDELRVYNKALTTAEALALYQAEVTQVTK
jgi:hypothetical protein